MEFKYYSIEQYSPSCKLIIEENDEDNESVVSDLSIEFDDDIDRFDPRVQNWEDFESDEEMDELIEAAIAPVNLAVIEQAIADHDDLDIDTDSESDLEIERATPDGFTTEDDCIEAGVQVYQAGIETDAEAARYYAKTVSAGKWDYNSRHSRRHQKVYITRAYPKVNEVLDEEVITQYKRLSLEVMPCGEPGLGDCLEHWYENRENKKYLFKVRCTVLSHRLNDILCVGYGYDNKELENARCRAIRAVFEKIRLPSDTSV